MTFGIRGQPGRRSWDGYLHAGRAARTLETRHGSALRASPGRTPCRSHEAIEVFNAAKEIAEAEKKTRDNQEYSAGEFRH